MINKRGFRRKKDGEPDSICYCRKPELIENYDKAMADNSQIWEVHHRKEEFYSYKELIERDEYFDVPPEDLIFLTKEEHRKLDSMHKRSNESNKGKFINRKDLSKQVLCVETGEVFESAWEAHRKTGIYLSGISRACNGKRNIAGGLHWQFV